MKLDFAVESLLPGERAEPFTWTRSKTKTNLEVVVFGRRYMVGAKTRNYGHPDENEDRGDVPDD